MKLSTGKDDTAVRARRGLDASHGRGSKGSASADAQALVATNAALQAEIARRENAEGGLKRYTDHLEELVKQRTVDLATAVKGLKRSNQDLERFAFVASHDLQEPLRMITSYSQLLAERCHDTLEAKASKYIDYILDGSLRMQRLINDVLTFSQVDTHARPFEATDTHTVLGDVVRNLQETIRESRAIVTTDELPTVLADAGQLLQVLQNLIANSVKFHGTDPPRVHVSAREFEGDWVFSVCDNGIGIEAQHADRIFVIFQRLHTREEYPGTGIGLAVCKRIVERHGGRIWFDSTPGQGSTFFFTIPKRQDREA